MRIAYIQNAGPNSGVGYRASHIRRALISLDPSLVFADYFIDGTGGVVTKNKQKIIQVKSWPGVLSNKSITWLRLGWKLSRELRADQDAPDVFHCTNQTVSFVAKAHTPSIVTVHDIIELLQPQSLGARYISRQLYSGIPQATHIIAVSHYTAKTIHEYWHMPAELITVIPNAVDPEEFHPIEHFPSTIAYRELLRELRLPFDAAGGKPTRVVLYVGSEHPRKNVGVALRAFAKALQTGRRLIFIKVGSPGLPAGRATLLEEIDRLGIGDAVRIISDVSTERLNELYNLADVFIFPSRFEGFGLPPLQAMAAGLPVVCSDATSLPEVTGNAALARDPDDVDGFADDIQRVLEDGALAQDLRRKGLARAAQFSWQRASQQVLEVYQQVGRL